MANANGACVSHQWIYALIWDDQKHGGTRFRLPRQRRYQRQLAKRAGLGKISPDGHGAAPCRDGKPTPYRPLGRRHGAEGPQESGLVTLAKRHSGYLLAARLPRGSHQYDEDDDTVIGAPPRGSAYYYLG